MYIFLSIQLTCSPRKQENSIVILKQMFPPGKHEEHTLWNLIFPMLILQKFQGRNNRLQTEEIAVTFELSIFQALLPSISH